MSNTTSPRSQFQGMTLAGAGPRPQDRADWRRPIRSLMLYDARFHLLGLAGAPLHVQGTLASRPISQWPEKARHTVRKAV